MTSLWHEFLGHPLVYNYIRPLIVGGIDVSEMYSLLDVQVDDVFMDIGCGTGNALNHIHHFKSYYGFDTDPVALQYAQEKFLNSQKINFLNQIVTAEDVQRISPTKILMSGLLHHLTDEDVKSLLVSCASEGSVRKIVTLDIVFLEGKIVNNFFARLDRGRFARTCEAYESLLVGSDFKIVSQKLIRSHPKFGLVYYWIMVLEPRL